MFNLPLLQSLAGGIQRTEGQGEAENLLTEEGACPGPGGLHQLSESAESLSRLWEAMESFWAEEWQEEVSLAVMLQ